MYIYLLSSRPIFSRLQFPNLKETKNDRKKTISVIGKYENQIFDSLSNNQQKQQQQLQQP
jgi:hypothetical protein